MSSMRVSQSKKRTKESEPECGDTKVFKDTAPTSHTPKAVSKWIDNLQLSKDQKKKLDSDADRLSKLEPSELQAKLLEKGLPMKTVAALRKSDLGIMVAAGYLLASKKVCTTIGIALTLTSKRPREPRFTSMTSQRIC